MLARALCRSPRGLQPRRNFSTHAVTKVMTTSGRELHPMWLRERCKSAASVCQETLQPLVQPHQLPEDLSIVRASIAEKDDMLGRLLAVEFSDGHSTVYDLEHLEREIGDFASFGVQQADLQLPEERLWDGITGLPMKRMSYSDLSSGSQEATLELSTHLLREGHAIVEGVPCEDKAIASFARLLSGFAGASFLRPTNWGEVFNVRSEPDGTRKDLAYTSAALSPHVDNPYRNPNPGFQLLHALENKCSTGLSFAVDGFAIAEQLRLEHPEYYDILAQVECRWENDGGDGSTALVHLAPWLSVNQTTGKLVQVRYSPKSGGYTPALPCMEQMTTLYRARRRFAELLNAKSNTVFFKLNKGDLWIFNNLRVLHGRTEFDPQEGARFLQGGYVDIDAITTAYFRAKYALAKHTP